MVNDNCDKINIMSIFVQPIEIIFSLFYFCLLSNIISSKVIIFLIGNIDNRCCEKI